MYKETFEWSTTYSCLTEVLMGEQASWTIIIIVG